MGASGAGAIQLQPGHIAIMIGAFGYMVWALPILVSGMGGRVAVRSLSPRAVWDYQRGQTALRHATRLLVVAGAFGVVVRSLVG